MTSAEPIVASKPASASVARSDPDSGGNTPLVPTGTPSTVASGMVVAAVTIAAAASEGIGENSSEVAMASSFCQGVGDQSATPTMRTARMMTIRMPISGTMNFT
jgi:hypothetical protein